MTSYKHIWVAFALLLCDSKHWTNFEKKRMNIRQRHVQKNWVSGLSSQRSHSTREAQSIFCIELIREMGLLFKAEQGSLFSQFSVRDISVWERFIFGPEKSREEKAIVGIFCTHITICTHSKRRLTTSQNLTQRCILHSNRLAVLLSLT